MEAEKGEQPAQAQAVEDMTLAFFDSIFNAVPPVHR